MKRDEPPPPDRRPQQPGMQPRASSPGEPSVGRWSSLRGQLRGQMDELAARARRATEHLTRRQVGVAGAILAGFLFLVLVLHSQFASVPQQTAPDTRRFSIANQPRLVFDHFIGNVNISPGADGQVRIKEKRNGETDAIQIHYAQRGDTITVTVDIPGGQLVDTWVDFDVSVPQHAGFSAAVAAGTLEATNLRGHIALSDTNGSIWATGLTGSISLKTQSGSINLTNVSGEVTAATQNGTITTTATHLGGHSTVQAENGTINFHGTLSRDGSSLFRNGNGAVGLTLPPDSDFSLNAHTASGSISSDFTGVSMSHGSQQLEAHGAVGPVPRAQLTIQTAGGSIGVHQGG